MKEESEYVGLKLNIQKTKIIASGPITSWQTNGETMETVTDFIIIIIIINFFLEGFKIPAEVTAAMKLKDTCSLEESYDKCRQRIKKQRYHFADKGPHSQSCGFSSSHVWM